MARVSVFSRQARPWIRRAGMFVGGVLVVAGVVFYATEEAPGRDFGLLLVAIGCCPLLPSLGTELRAQIERRLRARGRSL